MNGLLIIPILAFLILAHELGHFFAARSVGVKVEEFGIGIPPRLKGWRRKGVIWSINWIPFGGFVRVLGEDGKSMDPGSMNTKKPLQRAFFLAAGAGMNVLVAIVVIILVFGIKGAAAGSNSYVTAIEPGSPAAKAGWKPGDRLVEVGGDTVDARDDIAGTARDFAGEPMSVVIERRGQSFETQVVPRKNPPEGQGPMGVGLSGGSQSLRSDITVTAVEAGSAAADAGLQAGDLFVTINERAANDQFVVGFELRRFAGFAVPAVVERAGQPQNVEIEVPRIRSNQEALVAIGVRAKADAIFEPVPAVEIVPRGLAEAYDWTVALIRGVVDLFRFGLWDQAAGPIGMGQALDETIDSSPLPLWVNVAQYTIALSLNLAVLNLLPVPALDGGRLVFVLVELLRGGRKIAPEKEGLVHFAGLVIILGLMFVIAFVDIDRLRDGRSFLP